MRRCRSCAKIQNSRTEFQISGAGPTVKIFQNSGPGKVLKFQNFLVMVRSGPGLAGSDALIPAYNQLIANVCLLVSEKPTEKEFTVA